jgi:tRNA (guanine-N(7)-)-methyltransferase subunit TRM82
VREPPAEEAAKQAGEDWIKAAVNVDRSIDVSGLWVAPYRDAKGQSEQALVIGLEKLPAVFIVPVERLYLKTNQQFGYTTLPLNGPPLDVTCVGESMIVSLDVRDGRRSRLQAWKLSYEKGHRQAWHVHTERDEDLEDKMRPLNEVAMGGVEGSAKALDDLLYGVSNLRKRRGWGDPAQGETVEEDVGKLPPDEDAASD